MTPVDLLTTVVRPALADLAPLLGLPLASPGAELQLLVTPIHETGLRDRVQAGGGPARSFWQLERGLDDLAAHKVGGWLVTETLRAEFGLDAYVAMPVQLVRAALGDPTMDGLACKLARLLLWLDPHPLPPVGDEDGSWRTYKSTWRPGIERRAAFRADYAAALAAVRAAPEPAA